MIKMMIGLLAAMVFVLAVQAQAEEKTWQKNVTSIVDKQCTDELSWPAP